MEPIRPKRTGLTPEARIALGLDQPEVRESDLAEDPEEVDVPLFDDAFQFPEPEIIRSDGSIGAESDPGDIVDAEIIPPGHPLPVDSAEGSRVPILSGYEPRPEKDESQPKSGPPKVDEWLDFFSRVVLRVLTDWYISFAFSGVDEDALSERDIERIKMSKKERDHIAQPLAEFANKSKIARKHGRVVIAAADSIDSIYVLTLWAARVNRVARKYKPGKRQKNERSGQAAQNGNAGPKERFGQPFIYNPGSG
jgi:hypothetical protein